jgi:hypothetical protein
MNVICGAKKRDGSPCQKPPMHGATRCRLHGGATPKGIASPHYKGLDRSTHLPRGLALIFEQMASNPDLLSVRSDVALIDALIANKLPKLEEGESAQHWEMAIKLISKARVAYKSEQYGQLEECLHELEALADDRRLYYATEQEVQSQLELRRKLVDTENKILYNKEKSLTAEQAMLLVGALLESVRRNVKDANALNAIQSDFWQLTAVPQDAASDSPYTIEG